MVKKKNLPSRELFYHLRPIYKTPKFQATNKLLSNFSANFPYIFPLPAHPLPISCIYLKKQVPSMEPNAMDVAYEGMIMSHTLYHDYGNNDKFIPVLFDGFSQDEDIPLALQGHSKYWLESGLESLLRRLTGQPKYKMPDLGGARPVLPPEA